MEGLCHINGVGATFVIWSFARAGDPGSRAGWRAKLAHGKYVLIPPESAMHPTQESHPSAVTMKVV